MDLGALALVLAAAIISALYNVFAKIFQREEWSNRSALVGAAAGGGASIFLLTHSFVTGGPRVSPGWLFPIVATGVLNIGIIFAKLRARALEDVSLVAPIDSTTPAIVIVTAMIIVGEYPSRLGWIGIWILVVGTYILSIGELKEQLSRKVPAKGSIWLWKLKIWFAPFLALRRSTGVRWAFFAVGLSTLSLNYDGLAARRADVGFSYGLAFGIMALGNLAIALWRKEYKGVRISEFAIRSVILGLFFGTYNLFFGLAFRLSLVAYVGMMKRLAIPFTIIFAFLILKERLAFRQRIVGGTVMTLGAVLVAFGS